MKTSIIWGFTAILAFVFNSCNKEEENPNAISDPGECNGAAASKLSSISSDQFIILFDSSSLTNGRSLPFKKSIADIFLQYRIMQSDIVTINNGRLHSYVVKLTPQQASSLKKEKQIAAIEADRIFKLNTCFTIVSPRLITWNIKRVGYGNGTGKTAWVIDTGIDFTHPDLDIDVNRSISFVKNETSASDYNGHGTHVAGIIGAKNNHFGVLGVASGAKLVSLKVMNEKGSGNLSNIINALAHLDETAKPGDVVNMSLGADGTSGILDRYVTLIAAKGIYFSIAAGNEKQPARTSSPARVNAPNVYTVSAIDSLDRFAGFSNYGNDVVDYAAPGVQIISTYTNGRYARLSGTSMAAPHIAGLLLLNGPRIKTSGFVRNDPDGEADRIGGN